MVEYFLSLVILSLFPIYVVYRNRELIKPTALAAVGFLIYGTIWD